MSGPPGLSGFVGTRAHPSPVLKLFSCLLPRNIAPLTLHYDKQVEVISQTTDAARTPKQSQTNNPRQVRLPERPALTDKTTRVLLIKLAWARSGDKGDKANIGIIARDKAYLPYIWHQLDERVIADWFDHFLKFEVKRFFMPGLGAINYALDRGS